MKKCELCDSEAPDLIEIANPGRHYKYCCINCEDISNMILDDYPYNESWYKEFEINNIAYFSSNRYILSTCSQNGEFYGDEATLVLKELLRKTLLKLDNELKRFHKVDIIVWLLKFYNEISLSLTHGDKKNRLNFSESLTIDDKISLINLRNKLIYLIQRRTCLDDTSKLNSSTLKEEEVYSLFNFCIEAQYIIDVLDRLFYFEEDKGIHINDKKVTIISNEFLFDDFNSMLENVSETLERAQSKKGIEKIINSIYSFPSKLDSIILKEIGITSTEILSTYLFLANFVKNHSGLILLTPKEVDFLLIRILSRFSTKKEIKLKLEILKSLLCYEEISIENINFYSIDNFYSPFVKIKINNYYLIAISEKLISYCRSSFYYDLIYGVNSFIFKNNLIKVEYDKLKQNHITTPFEIEVKKVLLEENWITYLNLNRGISLGKKLLSVIPPEVGEIDIISYSHEKKLLVVIDCKYLFDGGANAKEIRNLRAKFFSQKKKKNYSTQIVIKSNWVKSNLHLINPLFKIQQIDVNKVQVQPIIVTNSQLPFVSKDKSIKFMSINKLENWIKNKNAANKSYAPMASICRPHRIPKR